MKGMRHLWVFAAACALAPPAVASAAARGPDGFGPSARGGTTPAAELAPVPVVTHGAKLVVSRLSSAPASAAGGRDYVLHGTVVNEGDGAAAGAVTVHLLRVGSRPLVVGKTFASVGAGDIADYDVTVRIPKGLRHGSYSLVACSQRRGDAGPLGCAAAQRQVRIGPAVRSQTFATGASLATGLEGCTSGAHTLSHFGDRVYPETGNGGYTSVHSDVYMVYDAATNLFLPGNHVDLTSRATQCLSDFSLDFERTSTNASAGPNMAVSSVTVNGEPAAFTFVQPTYPGDPNGQNDPDPAAHAMSQTNPVSATNSNPPACSPNTSGATQAGQQCPANKLVITPSVPIPSGATFTVTVNYTGRPGVHNDGDGTTEGWFRSNNPVGDGSFVTTEPVGTMAWMPLNNHPSAKPTYDFYDTVNAGKTAVGNGMLVSFTDNAPDTNFPGGSRTWHWRSPEGISSYLITNSVGAFDLTERFSSSGIIYYTAQGTSIIASRKATNITVMNQQEDITIFQSQFNGPFPFTTNGVVIGIPSASFQEEMQTKITFNGGTISLGTFHHENMHQWWGDNVSEGSYNLTFYKEGMATLGEYLNTARTAQINAGGAGTPAGDAAFDTSLTNRFNTNYANTGSLWTAAPSNPTAQSLFSTSTTYTRPATAYLALRQILGKANFTSAMQQIQRDYGGSSITEAQLEAAFHPWLPNPSAPCHARLDQFFTQWFDTVYPTGGGPNRPQITGPGLAGPGFFCAPAIARTVSPAAPTGLNGWYTGDVSVAWQVNDGGATVTNTGCVDETITTDGTFTPSCTATNSIGTAGPQTLTIQRDATPPVTQASVSPVAPDGEGGWYVTPVTVALDAGDNGASGVSATRYSLDGGPWSEYAAPVAVSTDGTHVVEYAATDVAGNVEATKSITFKIDATAPQSSASLSPEPVNGWHVRPTVTLVATDAGSGVAATEYALDGGTWTAYSAPFAVPEDGVHTLLFRATDIAGNVEAAQTRTFQNDATPPTPPGTTVPAPAYSTPGGDWYRDVVTVTFVAGTDPPLPNGDPASGVNAASIPTPQSFSTSGPHVASGTEKDLAGNESASASRGVNVDATAPTITASATTVAGPYAAGTWTNHSVVVTLSCTDGESGVGSLTLPQTVFTPGDNQFVTGTCVDNVGHPSSVTFGPIRIDLVAPEASLQIDTDADSVDVFSVEGGGPIAPSSSVPTKWGKKDDPTIAVEPKNPDAVASTYVIADAAGNTITLVMKVRDNRPKGQDDLDFRIVSIQYNAGAVIEAAENRGKFSWTVDKKTGELRNLHQTLEVKTADGAFKLDANYDAKKQETTKIKSKAPGPDAKSTVQGLLLIRLATANGGLTFQF
jgi:hypothetical protein